MVIVFNHDDVRVELGTIRNSFTVSHKTFQWNVTHAVCFVVIKSFVTTDLKKNPNFSIITFEITVKVTNIKIDSVELFYLVPSNGKQDLENDFYSKILKMTFSRTEPLHIWWKLRWQHKVDCSLPPAWMTTWSSSPDLWKPSGWRCSSTAPLNRSHYLVCRLLDPENSNSEIPSSVSQSTSSNHL